MAWVRPKHPKPKPKDPVADAQALRPILNFFSAGHVPRARPRSGQLLLEAPPPQPRAYEEAWRESSPQQQQHEIVEVIEYENDRPEDHAFSFSRDRLIPIAPAKTKQPSRVRSGQFRPQARQQPISSPPSPLPPPVVRRRRDISPLYRPVREVSPPPRPRSYAKSKPRTRYEREVEPMTRRHTERVVGERWASAIAPLEL